MSERLSPKEIKEDIRHDEFRSFVETAYDRMRENPKLVFGTIGGIFGTMILVTVLISVLDAREKTAHEQLAEALKIVSAPINETGATPEAKNPSFPDADTRRSKARSALQEVSVGSAEDVAGLYLAKLALEEGKNDEARQIWEGFLKSHSDHVLALSVRLNLIHLDRAEGNAGLVDELRAELNSAARSLPEDVLLYELAQTLESQGQDEEATELYQRILDDHPASPYAADARRATATT